jgi:phage terminase, large subunit, PBSX family|nr:MAG TPA: large terminase [Caudoviricetes sp.]
MTSKFTPKQEQVLKRVLNNDFFICGLHGAKRSGKTVLNNMIFMNEIARVREIADRLNIDEPMYILAGTSSTSIQNNIIQELYNMFGIEPKYDKHGAFALCGVKIIQVYTGSISGLKRARGFTAFGAYINEASLANEQVFKEIISRCSGEGARIVWDSNPDIPTHYLRRDYINSGDDMIIDFHFKLDDNTFMSDRYRENIKNATPAGVFYDRDILGLWVTGEGVVYRDFSEKMFVDNVPEDITKFYAGVDWGYEHYGSIVVIGESADGSVYLVEEHTHKHQEIDFWVGVAKDIKARYGNITFWADSARPEHVARFQREQIKTFNANKAVLSGIEEVAKLMKVGRFFVVSDKVSRFKDEVYQYVWNEKTGEPIKENDDVLDALRYAIYSKQTQPKATVKRKSLYGL